MPLYSEDIAKFKQLRSQFDECASFMTAQAQGEFPAEERIVGECRVLFAIGALNSEQVKEFVDFSADKPNTPAAEKDSYMRAIRTGVAGEERIAVAAVVAAESVAEKPAESTPVAKK